MLNGRLPEAFHEAFAAVGAELPVRFGAEERLGEAPAGIDCREGLQAAQRWALIEAILEVRVEFDRAAQCDQKDFVVVARAGGTAEWCDRIHHIGILRAPLVSLAAAHGPS